MSNILIRYVKYIKTRKNKIELSNFTFMQLHLEAKCHFAIAYLRQYTLSNSTIISNDRVKIKRNNRVKTKEYLSLNRKFQSKMVQPAGHGHRRVRRRHTAQTRIRIMVEGITWCAQFASVSL